MTFKNIAIIGGIAVAFYVVNLYSWGQDISNKVSMRLGKAKKFKLTGFSDFDWKHPLKSLQNLTKNATVDFYIEIAIKNENLIPITLTGLTGEIFYGQQKISNIENKSNVILGTGITRYDLKVFEKITESIIDFVQLINTKDVIRPMRFEGQYTVEIDGKKFTIPFNEKISIIDL